ncbi:TPA: SAM-dependent DNA methyltransferase [Burkholderia vietnamiensis]|uniref:DNA methylase adenine-specific domain-containing protein n=1 Tax=Pandoraea apista TaxID=93218 RepID=A0A5E5P220_9BURK|nr:MULTISPECIES: N-6 DNA methylase [Burkholderiaceae]MCA8206335.1 N-6 DNA methylase [Burkholderia vietnamiensis]VVG70394.1 hypothetical protein PAP18089_01354 [Pandoraea apista]HDR8943133.1 SAM-dependent DNA methyltransferase [Burkholderia vietnamiensis]HDR9116337.1 SAM-dependent DNA methyltransferase [Burkholderia vietnamiensis]HDR9205383.1 SAM-dependent DNA methyltransferase [Burkholderia vietnamiensis]
MARKTTTSKTTTPFDAFKAHVGRFAQRHPFRSGVKEVIDDLVQITFNLLSQVLPVIYTFDGSVRFDSRLVVELEDYRDHPAAWAELAELGSEYMWLVATAVPFADLLTDLYGVSIAKEQIQTKGQYMTSPPVADTAVHDLDGTKEEDRPLRVGDPTCGSGALLLAVLRDRFTTLGKDGVAKTSVFGNDIDPAMVKLATVQIGLSSYVHNVPLGCLMMHCADVIKDYNSPGTRMVTIHPSVEKSRTNGFWEDGEQVEEKVAIEVPPVVRVIVTLLAVEMKASAGRSEACEA